MEKSTEVALSPRRIAFVETAAGMLAGMWQYPVDGFEWRSDFRPLGDVFPRADPPAHPDPGPWLVPAGPAARRYAPLRRAGLLEGMDRVAASPTPERIRAFANRWGHLGLEETLVPEVPPQGPRMTSMDALHWGESLSTWRMQLMKFGDLRRLWRAVSVLAHPESWGPTVVREARAHLRDRIDWAPDGACRYNSRYEVADAWREWHEWIYNPRDGEAEIVAEHLAGQNNLEAARYYVHRQVNAEMRGTVNPAVLPYLGGAIRFFPASLMAAAWLRFAMELAGSSGRERECEYCRTPFLQNRRDQRFCGKTCQEASAYHRRTGRRSTG